MKDMKVQHLMLAYHIILDQGVWWTMVASRGVDRSNVRMSRKHPPFLETSKNSHGKWLGCHPLNTVVFFSNFSKLLKVIPKLVWVSCGGHQKNALLGSIGAATATIAGVSQMQIPRHRWLDIKIVIFVMMAVFAVSWLFWMIAEER